MYRMLTIAAGAVALSAGGFAFAEDSKTIMQDFDYAGFDRLVISGVYELEVRVGEDFSIHLVGPDYEMSRVEVSVKDGALELSQRDRKKGEKKRNNREGVDAVITMPSLAGLAVSGVVDGEIEGVDAKEFSVRVSGVGDVSVKGECGRLEVHLSGVGDLDAKDLECASAEVHVSGVGSASVFASEEAEAKVSGMGDIDVYGSPKKRHSNNSMFADVKFH